jgi:hypothetical protein
MAKTSNSSGNSFKISFGARKVGKAQKSYNKHNRTSARKPYRGQGK